MAYCEWPPDWTNEFSCCNLSRVTVVLSAKQEWTERKEVPWVEGSWLHCLKLLILQRVADCSVSAPGPRRSKRHRWNARGAWRKGTSIPVNNLETKHDTLTKERTLFFVQSADWSCWNPGRKRMLITLPSVIAIAKSSSTSTFLPHNVRFCLMKA